MGGVMRVMPITLTMDLSAPRMEPSTSAGWGGEGHSRGFNRPQSGLSTGPLQGTLRAPTAADKSTCSLGGS